MVVCEAPPATPVTITDNVGASITDGQQGFVVPIRDAEALAARLLCLYEDDDLRRAMGHAARQHVQQFTWDYYHQELADHYRSIAGAS
jgi:glycosyltransferase involved in cell wall biosynthesis